MAQPKASKTSKSVYTDVVAATIRAAYEKCGTEPAGQDARTQVVKDMAVAIGATDKSVIQHITRKGYYIRKVSPSASPTGEVVKKADIIETLATLIPDLTEPDLSSMEKCNKPCLQRIQNRLEELESLVYDVDDDTQEAEAEAPAVAA